MATTSTSTDRIHKDVVLRAPRARVWRALTDPQQLGSWFKLDLDRSVTFRPGEHVRAQVTYPGYEHLTWEATIDRMEPEHLFAWRWHPSAIEPGQDYTKEPTTLVTFELEEVADGTRLTVTESGFDAIPLERRGEAFRGNESGWQEQMVNIARYVDGSA
jgi:uncharacterized protein YndB with AHSA1/START domain